MFVTPTRLPAAELLGQMGLTQSSKFTSVGYGDTEFVNAPGGKVTTHVQAAITVTGDTYCVSTNVDQRLDIASVRAFLANYVALP